MSRSLATGTNDWMILDLEGSSSTMNSNDHPFIMLVWHERTKGLCQQVAMLPNCPLCHLPLE
jgi:hypothetical protein